VACFLRHRVENCKAHFAVRLYEKL